MVMGLTSAAFFSIEENDGINGSIGMDPISSGDSSCIYRLYFCCSLSSVVPNGPMAKSILSLCSSKSACSSSAIRRRSIRKVRPLPATALYPTRETIKVCISKISSIRD